MQEENIFPDLLTLDCVKSCQVQKKHSSGLVEELDLQNQVGLRASNWL